MHVVCITQHIHTYTDIPRWHRWTCSKKGTPKQISLHKLICTLLPLPSTTFSSLQRVCYCIDICSSVYCVCMFKVICMYVCDLSMVERFEIWRQRRRCSKWLRRWASGLSSGANTSAKTWEWFDCLDMGRGDLRTLLPLLLPPPQIPILLLLLIIPYIWYHHSTCIIIRIQNKKR